MNTHAMISQRRVGCGALPHNGGKRQGAIGPGSSKDGYLDVFALRKGLNSSTDYLFSTTKCRILLFHNGQGNRHRVTERYKYP